MNGKNKCKLLKEIRQKIADENGIEYVTSECKFQGECTGTCPKCEAEVRYLEQELDKRKKAGKAVAVAGIAATMVITASGCDLFASVVPGKAPVKGDVELVTEPSTETVTKGSITYAEETTEATEETFLVGEMPYEKIDDGTSDGIELPGLVPESTEKIVLEGDVVWPLP